MGRGKSNTDDLVPVYDKNGKIKYWTEKYPDGPGGWMPGMGLYPRAKKGGKKMTIASQKKKKKKTA